MEHSLVVGDSAVTPLCRNDLGDIKIVHVFSGPFHGGAARGALALHETLRENGVDSRVVSSMAFPGRGETIRESSWTGFAKIERRIRSRMESVPLRLGYPERLKTTFSTAAVGAPVWRHPWVRAADLIHLHWINSGFLRLEDIERIQKPIVWTMRDMWPMTGGCHYALDCTGFNFSCGSCPQLQSSSRTDVTWKQMRRKKAVYGRSDITFVGISEWVSAMARLSNAIPDESPILTIPNAIRTESFPPQDKQHARAKHGLPTNMPVILIGATSVQSYYKRFDLARTALEVLGASVFVALFGRDSKMIARSLPRAKGFGTIHSDTTLSELYSAADVFVAPSVAEAFGKTIVESMSCRTPVVAFNATGPACIIDHKVNGYLAKPFESEDLAAGISWTLEDEQRREAVGVAAREKVLNEFDNSVVAPQYEALYRRILDRRRVNL
jgi:glycosyltransferase involved in cell wall biosynthesis